MKCESDEHHRHKASQRYVVMILPLCINNDLFYNISSAGPFQEGLARSYFRQLLEGIGACHHQRLAHRDLKPENILLDDEFNLLIADFGAAALLPPDSSSRSTVRPW